MKEAEKVFKEVYCFCVKTPCTREGICKVCGKPSKITADSVEKFHAMLRKLNER